MVVWWKYSPIELGIGFLSCEYIKHCEKSGQKSRKENMCPDLFIHGE